ncbi:MAG TPA: NAD-dependent epimerase/dehydratase family protein, partial [Jatrophihabitans sp.]|nr:NAD-dependent epimerase/dehydratase family protein [Jatrophihabitans sp.]
MTVLLTGSQGRIGRSLSRSLPALGWQLRRFDRRPAGLDEPADLNEPAAGELVVGELTDPDALDRAMAGVEAVVHLAGQPAEAAWPVIR